MLVLANTIKNNTKMSIDVPVYTKSTNAKPYASASALPAILASFRLSLPQELNVPTNCVQRRFWLLRKTAITIVGASYIAARTSIRGSGFGIHLVGSLVSFVATGNGTVVVGFGAGFLCSIFQKA
jgi:hypothetical protein